MPIMIFSPVSNFGDQSLRVSVELSLGLEHSNITRVDTEPNDKGKLHKVINNFVFTSKRNRKK